jgi:hypothetical protein
VIMNLQQIRIPKKAVVVSLKVLYPFQETEENYEKPQSEGTVQLLEIRTRCFSEVY